jgi:hypothetical protein
MLQAFIVLLLTTDKLNNMTITHDYDEPKTPCNCWMEIKECYCIKK